MKVRPHLASALLHRDDGPNLRLAAAIAAAADKAAVLELLDLLADNDKNIRSDAIKVLYELGRLQPALVEPHALVFVQLLGSSQNRLVWGAMTVLDGIATINQDIIYAHLGTILDAAAKGSVIARDHAVKLLAKLAAVPAYAEDAVALLIDELKGAPVNQLPTYAALTLEVVTPALRQELERVILARLPEVEQASKRMRLQQVLKKCRLATNQAHS